MVAGSIRGVLATVAVLGLAMTAGCSDELAGDSADEAVASGASALEEEIPPIEIGENKCVDAPLGSVCGGAHRVPGGFARAYVERYKGGFSGLICDYRGKLTLRDASGRPIASKLSLPHPGCTVGHARIDFGTVVGSAAKACLTFFERGVSQGTVCVPSHPFPGDPTPEPDDSETETE